MLLGTDVCPQIGQEHIVIAPVEKRLRYGSEDARLTHAEEIALNELYSPANLIVSVIDIHGL